VDDDKTPLPSNSTHGTHVAGTIAAIKGNTRGIIGVAPNTKIMALKFGLDSVSEAQAIDFAIQNGAKVINASYGGGSFSTTEYDAISRFQAAGGVFVAAAGNSARNNDSSSHTYPSDYNLDNIISVAATDQNDALASFSNYGATSVDVGAPGVNIYSTVPSETSVLSEDFEGVVAPAVPVGWTATGNWGTYTFPSTTVLYGDTNYPYVAGANSTITSPTYDLSAVSGVGMSFWAQCDTEYSLTSWTDYMALELSSNGSTYTEYTRWDEPYLDGLNGDADPTGAAIYQFDLSLPNSYYTSNFKFRYRWVSNSSDNSYDGCWVDDVAITSLSDGTDEEYGFMNGTSMASPHVAGLVALAWEVKPTLTIAQVKNRILSTGDAIPALSGITVSERRINAFNAINNINTAPVVVDGSDYVSMDSSVILTLSGSDVDDDTLTYSIVSDVSNGTLGSIVGNQVVYTPTTSYLGPDSFTFKANDGVVDSNTGTMTLTVNPAVTITDVTNTTPTTTTVTVTWTTDYPSTSRVLYDTTSHPSPGAAPNYGYFLSTTESDVSPKVTSHSVGLTGLLPETKYYFRVVGFGTPEILSEEGMFTMATGPRVSVPEPPKKGPPVCSDTKPASSPDLFQINVASSTARLFFTPIANTDKFYISFSTNPSAEEHGGQVTLSYHGVQTITVNYLKSSTVYYFKVRGQNGCMPGDWSNIFKVTTRARGTMGTISAYRYTPPKPAPEKTVRRRR
jgi:subtilisin family serine protease